MRRHGLLRGERPAVLLRRDAVHRATALRERDVPTLRRRGSGLLHDGDARVQRRAALRGELLHGGLKIPTIRRARRAR
jgi:hypothetical protein